MNPVTSFVAVTWAPAMTAPVGSMTVPRIVPVVLCAEAAEANRPSSTAAIHSDLLRH